MLQYSVIIMEGLTMGMISLVPTVITLNVTQSTSSVDTATTSGQSITTESLDGSIFNTEI